MHPMESDAAVTENEANFRSMYGTVSKFYEMKMQSALA